MIEPLLTPAEVAGVLGIRVEEVWAICRRGSMPYIKLGPSRYGRIRIRPTDLRAYQRRGLR